MTEYAIFGGCVRSEIPLPELPRLTCSQPDWVIRRSTGERPEATYLGEDRVDATIRVRCGRIPDGFRLEFDDTGTFDVAAHGRDIAWTPGANSPMHLVRADLLGGVFSIALHLQGLLCLHGSAVALGNGVATGFLANKGAGKSTLATALCARGASLITDDMLPVDPGPPAMAWPSMPAVRLLQDSANRLDYATGPTHPQTGKYHVNELPPDRVARRRVPLAALYELLPVPSATGVPAVQRTRLTGPLAVTTLVRHNRAGTAIGQSDSRHLFMRASDIVRTVPVYRLEVARDFERLDDVIDQLVDWHLSRGAGDAARTASALTE
jgi:hypothetical protein